MSQGQLAARPQQEDKLATWMARDDCRRTIAAALGGYLDLEEFLAHLMIHISTTPATKWAPALSDCTVASQYKSIHICATLGLLPNFQQVALIPRKNGEQWELGVMPQWQGYKAMFERVPEVLEVRAGIVHVNDDFQTAGDAPDLIVTRHNYDPFDPKRVIEKIEDIRGSYVVFTFRDDRLPRYHFASAAYISKCRSCAQTRVIWDKWFEQMAIKTAFRSAYSRRVVNVDPMVAGRVEAFLRHEDALLGNDPRIIEHQPQAPAIGHSSRSAMLASQLQQPRETVPVSQEPETAPPEPRTLNPEPTEPAAGELVDDESEPQTGSPAQQSTIGQFLDMLASTKNRKEVERLRDHYTGPDSPVQTTPEERQEINEACNSKAAEFPAPPTSLPARPKKDSQKPLM